MSRGIFSYYRQLQLLRYEIQLVAVLLHVMSFIVDIDECQIDNGGCSQQCNNSVGSYNCSCISGYELTDDNHTCTGINISFIFVQKISGKIFVLQN